MLQHKPMKRAVITGAFGRLGKVLLPMLESEGWDIYRLSRNDLSNRWYSYIASLDVPKPVNALIHLAGFYAPTQDPDVGDEIVWHESMESNLISLVTAADKFEEHLQRGKGAIVAVSTALSEYSHRARYERAYVVSKRATEAFLATYDKDPYIRAQAIRAERPLSSFAARVDMAQRIMDYISVNPATYNRESSHGN